MDRPIRVSGPMVRALLDGRKTQTRRVLKPQPHFHNVWRDEDSGDWWQSGHGEAGDDLVYLPYAAGDRLWVREAWQAIRLDDATLLAAYRANCEGDRFHYTADGSVEIIQVHKWRSPIHMPRWASRLTLIVTDVRVQRLQEISEEDAKAEGVERTNDHKHFPIYRDYMALPKSGAGALPSARESFGTLWDSINAARGYGWDTNPWVVVVTFSVHRGNIDEVKP